MKKKIIVLAMLPTNILAAMSALKTLHEDADIAVTIVFYNRSGEGPSNEILSVIKTLACAFPFVEKVESLYLEEEEKILSSDDLAEATRLLKERLSLPDCDEIFYAHDVMGALLQLAAAAYPEAQRVRFGDALGMIIDKKTKLSLAVPPKNVGAILGKTTKKLVTTFTKDLREKLYSRKLTPHRAALILPIFHSGKLDKEVPLTICSKATVLSVIDCCIAAFPEMEEYSRELLDQYSNRKKFLLLTENYADSGRTTLAREIDMWCSLIRNHFSEGSVVFIKSHPGENAPRNELIKERLAGSHEIIALDDRFKRYPVELWRELAGECTVLCMSCSAATLKYLYDIEIIHPMTTELVEKWFPEWTWDLYKDHIATHGEPLGKLATWDGKSVLWSGQYNH